MQRIYLHGLGQTPSSWENVIAQLTTSQQTTMCFYKGTLASGETRSRVIESKSELKSDECSVCPDLGKMFQGENVTYDSLYQGFSSFCDKFDEKIDLCGLSLGGVGHEINREAPEKLSEVLRSFYAQVS